VNLLLDTHSLVWLSAGIKLGPKTLQLIKEADSVFVSALSIFELRLKQAKGKFPEAEDVIDSLETMGLEVLNLTSSQTKGYKIFSPRNKDPYDNGLVTIAITQLMPFVTADKSILSLNEASLDVINARQ